MAMGSELRNQRGPRPTRHCEERVSARRSNLGVAINPWFVANDQIASSKTPRNEGWRRGVARAVVTVISVVFFALSANAEDNTLTAKEKADGWQLLFDGTTFDHWM